MEQDVLLKVKGSTPADDLASVIAHGVYDGKTQTLRAIGAAAVNQAMKAVAIAQNFVGAKGLRILVLPCWADVPMADGTAVSALVFKIRTE
jgi:stage V sporulation protein S